MELWTVELGLLRMRIGCAVLLLALGSATGACQQPEPRNPPRALSDELNDNLPRWVRFSGEYRGRTEGVDGGAFQRDDDDAYFLNRIRLNLNLHPISWLGFGFQAQDAHVFGFNETPRPPLQDSLDLRQAYLHMENSSKTRAFRAGRQELTFGGQRLLGNANWGNAARVWDGIHGTLRRGDNAVDVFAASLVRNVDGRLNHNAPGNWMYGAYGSLETLVPEAVVEPYFLWHRSSGESTEAGEEATLRFATVGVRWEGKLPRNFDYETEMVKQAGSVGSDTVGAWAGYWSLGYTTGFRFRPHIVAQYHFGSGDATRSDGRRETFDQLYPSPHDKTGLSDQVGWRNSHNAGLSGEMEINPKVSLIARYQSWWLANRNDALYTPQGNVVVLDSSAGRHVGQELDGILNYALNPQVQIGGGYAHIFPGTFLRNATPGAAYNFVYLSFTFRF
ncbi:MAG: alginate export family protein [Candidatus Korobacteraceae bacterium]